MNTNPDTDLIPFPIGYKRALRLMALIRDNRRIRGTLKGNAYAWAHTRIRKHLSVAGRYYA